MQVFNELNSVFVTWQRWGGRMDNMGEIGSRRRIQLCHGDREG